MQGIDLADLPLILMAVGWLVFLEGLLSADNALVLAMMVRHLPREEQKRALRYGIWGAFAFRFIAVMLAKLLLNFWFLEVIGGLYLLYLAVSHVVSKASGEGEGAPRRWFGSGFWATVISVELADIAFSIDSILAAVAAARSLPPERIGPFEQYAIVVTGGLLGIVTMRFVAGYFIKLLEKYRGLESGAYGLVAWIGLKLLAGGLYRAKILPGEMNKWLFWIGMAVIVVLGFIAKPPRPPTPADTLELAQDMARAAGGGNMDDDNDRRSGLGGDRDGTVPLPTADGSSNSGDNHIAGSQPPAELPSHPG